MIPGLRGQWTGAWYEPSCADIEVAALPRRLPGRNSPRRRRGADRRRAALGARGRARAGASRPSSGEDRAPAMLVNAAGAWADQVAERCGVAPLGIEPKRRTVVQLRVGRRGLRDLPLVTDLHDSFYFKGEGDNSRLAQPARRDAGRSVRRRARGDRRRDRRSTGSSRRSTGRSRRSSANGRACAASRPTGAMKFGFDPRAPGFFWCAGQGGMGIQTAPAASLLCAALIRGEALPSSSTGSTPRISRRGRR